MSRGGGSLPVHCRCVSRWHHTTARSPVTAPPMSYGVRIAGLHVLHVELPQSGPVLAALVGVAIEVEIGRLWRCAEDRIQIFPVEPRIHIDVLLMQPEDLLPVLVGAANQLASLMSAIPLPCGASSRTTPALRILVALRRVRQLGPHRLADPACHHADHQQQDCNPAAPNISRVDETDRSSIATRATAPR